MLKALIQLFSESFLKSKKSWVGAQAMPKSTSGTAISHVGNNGENSFTAPSDGYLQIDLCPSAGFDLLAQNGGLRFGVEGGTGVKAGFIPLQKGQTAKYWIRENPSQWSNVFFYPTSGS